jgi:pimeloyl-ACP methyl ester carboxylesterase
MPRVAANGIYLYYEEFGAGAPILGIHGTPSSAVLWEEAARELAQIGRCIIYDRRGFGRSRAHQNLSIHWTWINTSTMRSP